MSGIVEGFVIDRAMDVRAALGPLMQAYFFEAVESEGVIRFAHRGAQVSALVDDSHMAVPQGSAASSVEITRAQETDLPTTSKLTYIEANADYRQAAIDARRHVSRSDRVTGTALPLVLRHEDAVRIAETGLQDAWVAREQARFSLPPSQLALDPGDVIRIDANGRAYTVRLLRLADGLSRDADAVATEPGIFGALAAPSRDTLPVTPPVFGAIDLVFLDLPLLCGDEAPHAPQMAALASPWPGSVSVYRSAGDDGFVLDSAVSAPAVMGETEWDLYPGPSNRWDRGNKVRVRMFNGELESASALAVLGGANVAAVGTQAQGFEVIQFQTAELVAPDTYDVSLMLRGQAGTEMQIANPLSAGSRFVLLTGALRQVGLSAGERGFPFNWRYGPSPLDMSSPSYTTQQSSFAGVGLRPLSPAHVRATRSANGDVQVTWKRRTRINGDAWEQLDVPLGEDEERYELDVINGGLAVRTLSSVTPTAVYPQADQIADFGAMPASLTIDVFQISASFGRGTPRRITLYV
ncbi:phage tail protein [Pyruvatibacter sp.]|uniref:phage tail protein n=1 Tax=Pyruvatibacter sp. TaxID=1981328 RepID=UPI0032EF3976